MSGKKLSIKVPTDAYPAYLTWCKATGHTPLNRTNFGPTIISVEPTVTIKRPGPRGAQVETLYGIGRAVRVADNDDGEDVSDASMDDAEAA
jgi:hypothetical protein